MKKSWDETASDIEAAFLRLPSIAPVEGKIPFSDAIPGLVRQLMLMTPQEPPRPTAQRKAARDIQKKSQKLFEAIQESGLILHGVFPRDVMSRLLIDLTIIYHFDPAIDKPKIGPPEKEYARNVARFIAIQYERMTGRRAAITYDPTQETALPSGDFYNLVRSIFDSLAIKANAEHQCLEVNREGKGKKSEIPLRPTIRFTAAMSDKGGNSSQKK